MKRWMAYLLIAVMLLCCACTQTEIVDENTKQVYYINNKETKVEVHNHQLQATTTEEAVGELMECLGKTPEKLEYKAPLAMNFNILSWKYEGGRVSIDMDEKYKQLPVYTEILVRAAIVRTLCQLDEVRSVGITVEGDQLFDVKGNPIGWMDGEQFINNDGNEINTYEYAKIKLYFANEEGNALIAAYRDKHYSSNTPIERVIVEELIAGPSGKVAGLYPAINPATKIINVTTKDGICYVNLNEDFLTATTNVPIDLAVYSVVNSLAELSGINKIQILINGETPENLNNSLYERNLDVVTTLN